MRQVLQTKNFKQTLILQRLRQTYNKGLCATLARITIWTEALWPGHFGLTPFGQGHLTKALLKTHFGLSYSNIHFNVKINKENI